MSATKQTASGLLPEQSHEIVQLLATNDLAEAREDLREMYDHFVLYGSPTQEYLEKVHHTYKSIDQALKALSQINQ